jgi:apolipoprotein D and lipocalin family protein
MRRAVSLGLAFSLAFSIAACAGTPRDGAALAPEPAKPIDVARFYSGRWYEIARTPMKLTDGCVAGATDYFKDDQGRLIDRDSCRTGTPEGKEKVFAGPVTILNPGQNTKVTVHYAVLGVFTVSKTYWMLDHGDDYGWFIVSDPQFKNLSLFTRSPRPAAEEVKRLTARAQALGYDPAKLEYPSQFPEGEGQP